MAILTYNGSVITSTGGAWLKLQSTSAEIGGRTYPTVDMPDGKTWLAVNLDYAWSGLPVPTNNASNSSDPQAMYYQYNETTYGWNGRKCGLLYNWYAVDYLEQNKATLCPGWHVPSTAEWYALATATGATAKLKATDGAAGSNWPSGWGGTDDYGFAALPAGYFASSFSSVGSNAGFWTTTEYNSKLAYSWNFVTGTSMGAYSYGKIYQYSVRLVKDTD